MIAGASSRSSSGCVPGDELGLPSPDPDAHALKLVGTFRSSLDLYTADIVVCRRGRRARAPRLARRRRDRPRGRRSSNPAEARVVARTIIERAPGGARHRARSARARLSPRVRTSRGLRARRVHSRDPRAPRARVGSRERHRRRTSARRSRSSRRSAGRRRTCCGRSSSSRSGRGERDRARLTARLRVGVLARCAWAPSRARRLERALSACGAHAGRRRGAAPRHRDSRSSARSCC